MRRLVLLFLASVSAVIAGPNITPDPKLLQDGVPISGLSGHEGESVTFRIEIPPTAESFVVKTSRGSGDIALYLRRNAHPTVAEFDELSDVDDRNPATELIRLPAPEAGTWYARIVGFTDFRNVRLVASYDLPRGVARPPRFAPAPGRYSERAVVRLHKPRGTTVRFTTDDTAPTATSTLYTGPITLTADTRLRAVTFGRDGMASIETSGDYVIVPAGTTEPITSGVPLHHLAAVRGTAHLFSLAVPADTARLVVRTEGGPGNSQLYARSGAAPTTRLFAARSLRRGNVATLTIENPTAGDWFFLLPARTTYSGVSLLATTRGDGADLIAWEPAVDPYLHTQTFAADDCAVVEGYTDPGTRRLLRFNTQTRNIGTEDLLLGDPEGNPLFEFATCHFHYHFNGFASYELLDGNADPVALGRKMSFCLLDGERWDPQAPRDGRFDCDFQGIQAGWADIYDAGLDGQWIDVTDVAPGTYTLVITMNPDQELEEVDYTNNSVSVEVVID